MSDSTYDYDDDDDDVTSNAGAWPLNLLVAAVGLVGVLICIGPFLTGL
jgi:hypothetical protein